MLRMKVGMPITVARHPKYSEVCVSHSKTTILDIMTELSNNNKRMWRFRSHKRLDMQDSKNEIFINRSRREKWMRLANNF